MSGGIVLSQKHGLNPALEQCFCCGEVKSLVLFGKLRGDQQAPSKVCLSKAPCEDCARLMQQGVVLISVDPALTDDEQNPHRTGGWCVVRDEMIKRVVKGKACDDILLQRIAFVPDDVWDGLGLPRSS